MRVEVNLRLASALDPYDRVLPTWVDGFQVGEGSCRIEHREIAFPGMEVACFWTENSFADRYEIPAGETHFAFALSPHHPVLSWTGHFNKIVNVIAVHRSHVEYTSVMPSGWSGLYICLNDELVARLDLLPESFWQNSRDPDRALLPIETKRFDKFREFVRSWFATVQNTYDRGAIGSQQAALLREQLLCTFRELLDRTFIDRGDRKVFKPSRRYWIFESACAIVDANLTHNLTTEDICQQLQVSPRSLQYAFKEIVGIGLQQYIRARKLNAVRDALIRHYPHETTVGAIASAYGFAHASRFSEQFYRLFGEHPSNILFSQNSSISNLYLHQT